MKAREIQDKFLGFFVKKDHLLIPQTSLIPENDPTLLFTSAGMVALKPYFLNLEKPPHPRLVNIQRCLRTTDIDLVGRNARTLSFFEMLGSWSIGDYFKEEAIKLAWEFLTESLGFAPEVLWATYFAGDPKYPKILADKEAAGFWQKVGMKTDHIIGLGFKDNFWQPGETGPCGPSTEVYLDRGSSFGCGQSSCRPGCDCDRFLEIWNAGVFMQYDRTPEGKYLSLPFNSVDTGAGLERLAMVLQGKNSVFETDLFWPLIEKVADLTSINYGKDLLQDQLVNRIADHLRASIFLISDGVLPGNQEQGYILRRLIRRAVDAADKIGLPALEKLVSTITVNYQTSYPHLADQEEKIKELLAEEERRYRESINRGRKEISLIPANKGALSGREVFYFTQTFGLPSELVKEELQKQKLTLSETVDQEFIVAEKEHQQKSRSIQKFKGGLADNSDQVIAYHTATHLLHQALREVLGSHVRQAGSNITSQRLRFDYTHPVAPTKLQISQIEEVVNQQIKANLSISCQEKTLIEAKKDKALAFFTERYYEERVKLYQIGDFSKEVCGGPHLRTTGGMGQFVIVKEKSVSSGKRRIYGILKKN